MSTEHWQRIWALFEEAVKRPTEDQPGFLDEACGRDEKLRQGVEEMLAADQIEDSFLDQPFAQPGIDGSAVSPEARGDRTSPRGMAIGPYRLLRRIGQGGMGTVYLAVRDDDAFRRRVVVKLVRPGMESKSVSERLRTERQILASLDHPHIARLYDGGTTDEGLPYFVLEYVEGVPIDEYCDQNRLSVDERLTLFRKVCAAVHYAHQNLVVHRDLKPSNILTVAEGDPKLLDFGIAKLLNPTLASSGLEPTATWHRVLTPSYASPEQIRGKLITTASDVYSLGVLLYKLLTGRLPHRLEGCSPHEIESILTGSEPLKPSVAVTRPREEETEETSSTSSAEPEDPRSGELRRQLTGDLDAIVLKALRSAPQRRYSSVEQLDADIERFQVGLPVAARSGTWRYRAGKFLRRNRSAVAAAVAVALLVVGFALAMALQAARVAFERDQAHRERDKKAQVLSLVLELFRFSDPFVLPGEELTVREALERSVPVLKDELRDQPGVRAALLHTSGSILAELGVLKAARDQLLEAFELREDLYSDDHPELAESMTSLASVYKKLGDLAKAEALARRAVAVARGPRAAGQPGLLCGALNELASVLCYQSDYEAAEAPVSEALALARDLSEDNKQIAALEHLAKVRSSQKDDREAVRLYREALALRRARYGERHPAQIATLNNLGVNLRRMGASDAAEQVYEEALELQREIFGAEHADIYLLNNLAMLLQSRDDFRSAERLFREAREVVAAGHGPRHQNVFLFELRIAHTRIRQGAAAEAEASLRGLLEHWRRELGDHWRIEQGVNLLGESVSLQGRCGEAEPLLAGSFEKLLEKAPDTVRQGAFQRLREHFERCGEPREIVRFQVMLEALPRK